MTETSTTEIARSPNYGSNVFFKDFVESLPMPFYAHSGSSDDLAVDGQRLADHLRGVAAKAADLADRAAADPALTAAARTAGLLHDLGKYQPEWQAYLAAEVRKRGSGRSVPHAIHGAAYAFAHLGNGPIALAIAAHHSGLADASLLSNALESGQKVSPSVLSRLVADARGEIFELPTHSPSPDWAADTDNGTARRLEFWTRVLFSILVDADRLETERFSTKRDRERIELDPSVLLAILDGRRPSPRSDTPVGVNALRNTVYAECVAAGRRDRGFFHLTVPTGGGKTRSGMAFALAHAKAHNLRRVFVVIPYLSIIEQNAREYRRVFGDDVVLEHHSAVAVEDAKTSPGEAYRSKSPAELAAENWDAPVVVTTSVQFLETLLAASPRRCRRLHNVARSVVVFDEAQCLPTRLLNPLLDVFRDLVTNWGCSVVFSTATQPMFKHSPGNLTHGLRDEELNPVLSEGLQTQLFRDLQRVTYRNETATPWDWDELVRQLVDAPDRQALCVLNTRRHAKEVWEMLRAAVRDQHGDEAARGVRHLSSAMCAEHRTDVLGKRDAVEPGTVYQRLRDGEPCWLISTQVVECGVDVSFPRAFRAVGPLDSIVQVGGRVNREGERTDRGEVVIFRPADDSLPTGIYKSATGEAMTVLGEIDPDQLATDPAVFERYFRSLYGRADTDGGGIQRKRAEFKFQEVAELARVIEDGGRSVIVPYQSAIRLVQTIKARGWYDRSDLQTLQRYSVNLRPYDLRTARELGLGPLVPGGEDDGPWVLPENCYDKDLGVVLRGLTPEQFIV
jgi:CRISPR-associated endonuclease/helicase Cas3